LEKRIKVVPAKALPPRINHIISAGPVAGISPVLSLATLSVLFTETDFFIKVGVGVMVMFGVGEGLVIVAGRNLPKVVRRLVAILLLDKSTTAIRMKPRKIKISLLDDIISKFGL